MNTSHLTFLSLAFVSIISLSFSIPDFSISDTSGGDSWTLLQKDNGVMVSYDIKDCLKDNLMLCLKVVNMTDKPKKLRFTTEVINSDNSKETFNFIKTIAPLSTERADCSEDTRLSGLLRPLKNANEQSVVSIHFQEESSFSSN